MWLNRKIFISLILLSWILPAAFAQEQFNYNPKGKRNPFIPLVTPEGRLLKLDKQETTSTHGLLIEGIIYDKLGRSFAIVNSIIVGVGDRVGEFQVLKILEDKIVFIKQGELLEVGLTKKEVK